MSLQLPYKSAERLFLCVGTGVGRSFAVGFHTAYVGDSDAPVVMELAVCARFFNRASNGDCAVEQHYEVISDAVESAFTVPAVNVGN